MAENIARLKKQRQDTLATLNLKKFQAEQETLFQEAEKFNQQQAAYPYLRATASDGNGDPAPAQR